jgi:hypothetical protein
MLFCEISFEKDLGKSIFGLYILFIVGQISPKKFSVPMR